MSWLRELGIGESEAPPGPLLATDGHRGELGLTARLRVQTLGGLRICLNGEDLTARQLARPTVSYLWQYLLRRAIQEPRRVISGSAEADEVYPGIHPETEHARTRRPMTITDKELMLDTTACHVDVVEILQLAAET